MYRPSTFHYKQSTVINYIILLFYLTLQRFPISFIYCFLNGLNLQTVEPQSHKKKTQHLFIFGPASPVCVFNKKMYV